MRYVEAFSGSSASAHETCSNRRRRTERDDQKTHFVDWEPTRLNHHLRPALTKILVLKFLGDIADILLSSDLHRGIVA